MNALQIQSDWEIVKMRLKHNFKHLTDADLIYTEGKEDQLIKRLQKKLGQKEEEIIEILNRISLAR